MKKFTKYLLIGSTLSSALFLGACSSSSSDSNIVTIDGVEITNKSLIESVQSSVGEDNMKRVFLYEYLDSKYKVTEDEINAKKSELDDLYGGEGSGTDYLRQNYGYTDERIHDIFKEQVQVEKALKDFKNITDKDIKEIFNKDGNNISRDVIEVHVSANTDGSANTSEVDKIKKLLESGKKFEEIKKSIGDSKSVDISQKEYTNFDLDDITYKLHDTKKGEIVEIDNTEKYGVTSLYLILDTKKIKFEDVKEKITQNLIYSDSNYEAWLYNQIIDTKDVKVSNKKFNYIKDKFVITNEKGNTEDTKTDGTKVKDDTKTNSTEAQDDTKTDSTEAQDDTKTESTKDK